MPARVALTVALMVLGALSACGHDRPPSAARLAVPLVPTVLPDGYVVSRIDERPAGEAGRWIDFSLVPRGNARNDATGVVSLHQYLDVNTSGGLSSSFFKPGRRTTVRGRPGVCGEDGVLRWIETDVVLMAVGGAEFSCEEMRPVAESLVAVTPDEWEAYVREARDQP